jgi:hypothetical protein
VTETTCIIKLIIKFCDLEGKISFIIIEETITIATLTKLFPIKIVAKSFFGLSSSFKILLLFLLSVSLDKFSFCEFDKPKIATSDPERRADKKTKINIAKAHIPILGFEKSKTIKGVNKNLETGGIFNSYYLI